VRIAYLSCDFGVAPSGTQGSSVHLRSVVSALRDLGHEVHVFSPGDGEDDPALPGFHRVPLAGFAKRAARAIKRDGADLPAHLASELRRLLYAESVQRVLLPHLEELEPDFLYERYSLFSYAGVELARRLRIPAILEMNAPLAHEGAKYRGWVLRDAAREMEREILCAADHIFVVSGDLAVHAQELGVDAARVTVLPNGVDAERFRPGVDGESVRRRLGLEGRKVVAFVGSLKPWHDLDTLVEAVRRLRERDPQVHLLAVGDGPRLGELAALPGDLATCPGAVPHEEVPAILAAADVVAVPYSASVETYFSPLKLFEAMAVARPVVAAAVGQVRELLEDGRTARLYPPSDAEALAAAIRSVLDSDDHGAAMGRAAREWVLDGRTWRAHAERIVAVASALRERERVV
jgi:glycosyltransferase involved in cell wall biosynthesis